MLLYDYNRYNNIVCLPHIIARVITPPADTPAIIPVKNNPLNRPSSCVFQTSASN